MIKIASALIVCATLFAGCQEVRALPDPSIPHRLSRPAEVWVWVRRADGSFVEQAARADAGWYLASPQILDGK